MSRLFEVNIRVNGISAEQLATAAEKVFGITELPQKQSNSNVATVTDYINLCAGEKEHEAHRRLAEEVYKISHTAKVETEWTYMEEMPHDVFGDDI